MSVADIRLARSDIFRGIAIIVFVNGSFGIGKTMVANMLAEKRPQAMLYDPEEVGFMLRNILQAVDWSGDFQDYPMWRNLVPEVGRQLASQYGRPLVIPMTIWRESYFREVTDGFKSFDVQFHHFCLTAPLGIVHERLRRRRGQQEGDWVYAQAKKCADAFISDLFDERIATEQMNPDEIVQHILSRL